jgi:tRNA(Ile)-lysidine synthetase-like protein
MSILSVVIRQFCYNYNMNAAVAPGTYVVAVSGGVDSMVLLDALTKQSGLKLIVAHFDHGMRTDSTKDRELVAAAAHRYGLPFVSTRAELGFNASEAVARQARYTFLYQVMADYHADAIITAHHQDDSIETAIINLVRGTGRKGLNALRSTPKLLRPFLHLTKKDVYEYARQQISQGKPIPWREDSTNNSDDYLRNYIRHHVVVKLNNNDRKMLLSHIAKAEELNPQIDEFILRDVINNDRPDQLNRYMFIMLPYDVSCETMAAWLRLNHLRTFDRKQIARLVVMAKVAAPGKLADINTGYFLKTEKTVLRITRGTDS